MRLLLTVVMLGLTACASQEERSIEQSIVEANALQMKKPTLTISCDGPCSAEYHDPNKAMMAIPHKTNIYDFGNTVVSAVAGAVVPVVAGQVMKEAFNAVGTNTTYTESYNQTATPTVVNQPDPVVVNPADPIIVAPSEPVLVPVEVVNPVIVNPVIVDPTATP